MTTTTTWHKTPPDSSGLYIASSDRHAGYIRYWTGKHWTAPLAVHDLHLTDRIPTAEGRAAATWKNRPIEWLEKVTIDAEGFISWGGLQDEAPVPPDTRVVIRKGRRLTLARAGDVGWGTDVASYMVARFA